MKNKKVWLIALAVIALIGLVGMVGGEDEEETTQADREAEKARQQAEHDAQEAEEESEPEAEEQPSEQERLEEEINAFVDDEFNMEALNSLEVEETEDGFSIALDYLHIDNPDGYSYLVQINALVADLTDQLENYNVSELDFVAEANLTRDGESVVDGVYEVILNDIEGVTRDNIEEQSTYYWTNSALDYQP